MLSAIQMFYDEIFTKIKPYIIEKTTYKPYVFKQEPKDSVFPLVTIKNTNRNLTYTTLNYKDETYLFTLSISIYATTKDGISGKTVCEDISNVIEKFFYEEMKMTVNVNPDAVNIDANVDRTVINISCKIDTKYKDRIVYSPV